MAWPRANGSRAVGWRGDWTVPDRRRHPRRLVRALPGQGGGRRARCRCRRAPTGRGTTRSAATWSGAVRTARAGPFTRMRPGEPGQDRWHATIRPDAVGAWTFTVEAFQRPVPDLAERGDQEDRRRAGRRGPGQRPGRGRRACSTAARDSSRPPTGPGSPARSPRCATTDLPLAAAGLPGAGAGRPALAAPGAGAGHHRVDRTRSGSTASGRSSRPGTSSSPAPRARGRRRRPVGTAPSRTAAERLPGVAAMGFDVLYLPPIHPIGRVNRKGRNNALDRRAERRRARRGRSAPPRAATTPSTPTWARSPTSAPSCARPRAQGLEVALDLALQCAPDHPWVTRAPGVVHHAARRHHRVRGEPAEEVPGHLPGQLRQRPGGHPGRGAAGRAALDRAGRQDLPGGQPAHQAARLLGLADRRGQGRRPGRALPGRGVHPAGDDARPRQDRLHPVLHLLHLAQRRRPRCGSTARSWSPRPTTCGRTSGRTRRTSCTSTCSTAARPMFKIRAVLAATALPVLGHVRRLRAVRARGPAGRRGVPRQREVRATPAGLGRRREAQGALAGAVPRPASTRSAATTRPCTSCATSASTRSTTTACSAGPSTTRTATVTRRPRRHRASCVARHATRHCACTGRRLPCTCDMRRASGSTRTIRVSRCDGPR